MTDKLDNAAPFNDAQGTPVPREEKSTGAGAEASEGIHGAPNGRPGKRKESEQTSLEDRASEGDGERRGSEPLTESEQHRSGYGGGGTKPRG